MIKRRPFFDQIYVITRLSELDALQQLSHYEAYEQLHDFAPNS